MARRLVSDNDPCPSCGIPYDLLPIGHDLITPMDGSPQTCEVLPEPDKGIEVERDEDGEPAGLSPLAGTTRYSRHVLPSGMVVTTMMPPFDYTYSTPLFTPTSPIPFKTEQETRDEAAAKVLAVLGELPTARSEPTLAGKPCPACAFRPKARPQLPRFPLPPYEPYEPWGERMPYRLEFYGADPMAHLRARLSIVI